MQGDTDEAPPVLDVRGETAKGGSTAVCSETAACSPWRADAAGARSFLQGCAVPAMLGADANMPAASAEHRLGCRGWSETERGTLRSCSPGLWLPLALHLPAFQAKT